MSVCGYAYDTVGVEGNKDYLSQLGAHLGMLDTPWIYAADHNVDPPMMEESGLSATIAGRMLARDEATCRAGSGSVFDYFVLSHHFQ